MPQICLQVQAVPFSLANLFVCVFSIVWSYTCRSYKIGTQLQIHLYFFFLYFGYLQIIQDCDSRMGDRIDEFLESVVQVLPPHPSQLEFDEDNVEDKEAPGDQQMEDVPQNKLTC